MFKLFAVDACVMANPKQLNFGQVNACSFTIGTTTSKVRTFTSMEWCMSVVRVLAIGKPAKFAYEKLQKGCLCFVEGEFSQKVWTRSVDGVVFPLATVTAQRILLSRPANQADILTVNDTVQAIIDGWAEMEGQIDDDRDRERHIQAHLAAEAEAGDEPA